MAPTSNSRRAAIVRLAVFLSCAYSIIVLADAYPPLPKPIDFCDFFMPGLGYKYIPAIALNNTPGDHVYGGGLTSQVVQGVEVKIVNANSEVCVYLTPVGPDMSCGARFYVNKNVIASRTDSGAFGPNPTPNGRMVLVVMSNVELSDGKSLTSNNDTLSALYRPDRRCVVFYVIESPGFL